MTALKKYARLEAAGLWRPDAETQRREVIVSIGEATLVITNMKDQPLTHWSLAAIERANPGQTPAIYHPDGDPDETLELGEDETQMVKAIETLRNAISRTRPRPGRLRLLSVLTSLAAVVALGVFWLPDALIRHAVTVVPDTTRATLGRSLRDRIERVTGPACKPGQAAGALNRLARRTGAGSIVIVPGGTRNSLALPGGIIVLNRSLVEDWEEPDVVAGYIIAETFRRQETDPLAALLEASGPMVSFRLLTTGEVPPAVLDDYAELLMKTPRPLVTDAALLDAFERAAIRSTPYARAIDVTGETTLGLIEADPMNGRETEPVLPDRDWILLQAICES